MKNSSPLLFGFLKSRLTLGSTLRAFGVIVLSLGTTLSVVYTNYYNYWEGTIYRTQTVDFNILSNLLPTKISILLPKASLSKEDADNLQQAIDSNYGLFGIVITDCKYSTLSCPNQKVLFASQSKIEETKNGGQRLVPLNDYAKIWASKIEGNDGNDSLDKKLGDSHFVLLYSPPPVHQEWKFQTPRDDLKVYSDRKNRGSIIGRAYFLRADRPSFIGELQKWLIDIPSGLPFNSGKSRISSRSLVYNSLAISALITGMIVLLIMEFAYYLARVAQESEAKTVKDKLNAEQNLRSTLEKVRKANKEKNEAEETALIFAQKSEQAIQDKLKAEEAARAINQQIILEKEEAEKVARIAAQKSEQAIQDKFNAEEAARIATEEREQARKDKNDLYETIEETIEEETGRLLQRLQQLELENSELKSLTTREIIRLPQLPNDINAVLELRNFFEWIDLEPRKSHEVESWLKRKEEIRALIEIGNDGYSYLNALGNLLYDAVKRVQDDRPRVRWPKPSAIPPFTKNCVSEIEHRRPRGWERFVGSLCDIDCVSRVSYDENAYGGSIIKVIDAQHGTLVLRYGSADLWLPLRIETTARGQEEINLIIEYIGSNVM